MLRTPLCDLLGIDVPIIQAGMGWDKAGTTTPPELVAAVSNAGGLGVIGGSPLRPDFIRERIRRVKALTNRPFGVDSFIVALDTTDSLYKVSFNGLKELFYGSAQFTGAIWDIH